MSSLTSKCHNIADTRTATTPRETTDIVFSATESAYFGSLKHCQFGSGNVGIVFAAVAAVAAVPAAAAALVAAAGCIPQCFAVGY